MRSNLNQDDIEDLMDFFLTDRDTATPATLGFGKTHLVRHMRLNRILLSLRFTMAIPVNITTRIVRSVKGDYGDLF